MTQDVGAVSDTRPNMLATMAPPIIAVVNQKGGVGKTTTAINLSAAMAEVGHPTLLVDLDPQANSTSGLGLDPARARLSVYHLLTGEAAVEQVVQPTGVAGLTLVPSHIDLAGAEIELAGMPDREALLQKGLAVIPPGVEIVLIDCPPSSRPPACSSRPNASTSRSKVSDTSCTRTSWCARASTQSSR